MSLENKLLNLKEDIKFVKDGFEFAKPELIGEDYLNPNYLNLDDFNYLCSFVEAFESLIEELEKLIEELEE